MFRPLLLWGLSPQTVFHVEVTVSSNQSTSVSDPFMLHFNGTGGVNALQKIIRDK